MFVDCGALKGEFNDCPVTRDFESAVSAGVLYNSREQHHIRCPRKPIYFLCPTKMERKHTTEAKKRGIQRSLSCSSKFQPVNGGNTIAAGKSPPDEVDNIKKRHANSDMKSDIGAKARNRALYNKLRK